MLEQAPHECEVCAACLFAAICLSVCLYVYDTKIYKNSTNLRVPSVVDCNIYDDGFSELPCMPMLNKHVVTNNVNKQVSSKKPVN